MRLLLCVCLLMRLGFSARACTTVVVGRDVSATGRVIVGHNEDAGEGCVFSERFLARTAKGDLGCQWIAVKDENGCPAAICESYLNECGVLVVSNNALCEPCDDPSRLTDGGVLGEVREAVGRRAKTAREAVDVITNLVATYGYSDPGRIYTVADAGEAWQVTVVFGKRFVARRCPNDKVTLTANCCTVRTFEPGDILSDDFAKAAAGFDFAKACQRRGWWNSQHYIYRWRHLARLFSGRARPEGEDCPYAVVPARKVGAADVQKALSSHYEGTADEIPVGSDGRRHDESVRTGICRAETLYSGVWSFGARPEDVSLDLAAGSPCCHSYVRQLPLRVLMARTSDRLVSDLLSRMTLEEKVGQLVQVGSAGYASDDQSKVAIGEELRTAIRAGRVGSLIGACGVTKYNELQRLATEESRLGIPLLVGHDVIHGCRTVLPIPLALSCSWDAGLWRRGAEMMAVEALTRGCNWTFNPMVDISRDARWGRIAESPGQDPFLAAHYAAAMVKGYQGDDPTDGRHIAACLKHYLAYGACEGGRDYNTVELSDDTLRNVYLPPFMAGVAAGALTVMPAFHAINGEPCSANRYLLTNVLRGELGFAGFTISDYNAVGELASGHAVAASPDEAAVLAVSAGMDMDMMSGSYRGGLLAAVRDGRISESVIDEAVRRVLTVKRRLGLFAKPYVANDLLASLDLSAHHALAREAAAKSVVLVKNAHGTLPLAKDRKVVLLGSLADDRDEMLGCWQTWKDGFENATVREGLIADGLTVSYVRAYTPTGAVDRAAIRAAVARADVVVAAFGESCWDYASMNGENCSRADIGLPGCQREAIDEIKASGKPFVALLFCGRPLAVPELLAAADAVVVAWNPGSSGGWGLADVLTGVCEPYGRLTADFPHKTGECPLYYNRLPTGRPWKAGEYWVTKYIDAPSPGRSLLPFGFGLTYTTFRYSKACVATEGDNVVFSATVTNAGTRSGSEVVQVYVRDLVAKVSRPRRELKGFSRVLLGPGESREVRIAVPKRELGYWHRGTYCQEPGAFAAWIGPDSDSGEELLFSVD